MNKILLSKDNVSICHKENCINVSGESAKLIAVGTFAMLFLMGISSLIKNN